MTLFQGVAIKLRFGVRARTLLVGLGLAALAAACGRGSPAADRGRVEGTAPAPRDGRCDHAVCGDDFFVDASPVSDCAVGGTCTLALTLVAAGDYHINDEYPYKFKADNTPGVAFLGTDSSGKNVFSKSAENWSKKDEKTGTMTVTFRPSERGRKAVGGVFKLSVCSLQNCRLEVQHLNANVAVP